MRNRAALECRAPASGGPIISLFSFAIGGSVSDPRQSDLCFYFDSDDCAGGALVGHHDKKGWLFPIGKWDWRELQRGEPPSREVESTAAITPITTAQEGSRCTGPIPRWAARLQHADGGSENNIGQPAAGANGEQLMSRQHHEGCIPSRIMSPWLSSSFGLK
jgi:hypothetical protein